MTAKDNQWTTEEIEKAVGEKFGVEFNEAITSKPVIEILVYAFAVLFVAYHVYYGWRSPVTRTEHGVIHLGWILAAWGLLGLHGADRSTRRGQLLSVGYGLYTVLAFVPTYYFYTNFLDLRRTAGSYSEIDLLVGLLLIVLTLIACYNVSRVIFGVAALGILYAYFGPHLPGMFTHQGLGVERIIAMNTAEFWGIYGRVLQVGATWVVIFVILAGIIEMFGGMKKFVLAVTKTAARSKYIQIGQIAVFASMVFGSLNGAATANVATTGSFTIPLMKENGYPGRLAAGIESVASSGGQVLPPVMGAGAFLMAELIGPNYAQIVIAAALPAVLFYLSIAIAIYLFTNRANTDSMVLVDEDRERGSVVRYLVGGIANNVEYILMLAVLLYWLLVIQADPMYAGALSILALVGVRAVRIGVESIQSPRETIEKFIYFGRAFAEGSWKALRLTVQITVMLAALGIIIRAFVVTGFAQSLSRAIVLLAGGEVILLVILAAVTCILFGLGLPTVAAYLLVALFVAPSLTQTLGIPELSVHLFVFYFAIASGITPPIAVAVIVANGIAGAKFLESALDALRVGFPMFLLPFVFIARPEILTPSVEMALLGVAVLIAFTAMAVATIGTTTTTYPVRIGFGILALAILFFPSYPVQAALSLVAVVGLAFVVQQISISGAVTKIVRGS